MMKMMKRGLSFVLALVMIMGLLPVTAFAAVDSSGRPKDLKNEMVVSIYTTEGTFPGEPATHGSSEYISFNSNFAQTSASGQFKSSAESELDLSILEPEVLVQGASNGNNKVWGVFSADGLDSYFLPNASIIQPANEAKIIRSIKTDMTGKTDEEVLSKYEIIWYVIKLQHSPGIISWFDTTEWHIDGIIKEKTEIKTITINYYGNGNTSGSAPDGVTDHVAGEPYTIQGSNMTKKIGGVEVAFLGWSAKADGTGEEEGFYQPGQVINPTKSISLYAMWDTTTQYTATVKTYLDGTLTSANDIHEDARELYLSTDEEHYYKLTKDSEGIYTTKITGNGKFHLYLKNDEGTYTQLGRHQLTIYNQNGSLEVHHYSVTYDPNEGAFATEPGKQVFAYSEAVTAIEAVPTREGYRFLGWKDAAGNLIQPGKEVTASITAPIKLTAQWEKNVNVTINVTIDHNDPNNENGYDKVDTRSEAFLALVSRENDGAPYLETGDTVSLSNAENDNKNDRVTVHESYTLTDMPGGDVDYTVVASKSGYDTAITATQQANGDWVIDVQMSYRPTNFDVEFTVEVDEDVPDQHVPVAAIVKVTFWAADRNQWEIITQQAGNAPGVRVDIDPKTRTGSGSYPVWKSESEGEPYGYRIRVTSFVYSDGTIVPASEVVTQYVAWTDNAYTATVSEVTGGKKYGESEDALYGAYFENTQHGVLNAVITMDVHDVIFDAQGGKVNGVASQTVEEQYKIPSFKDYVPTREGGYIFDGWYEDAACTVPATEGEDIPANVESVTLYAKWIEPLTISGAVTILGTYKLNNQIVPVNDVDKATEAIVVLLEKRDGNFHEVDSCLVEFTYGEDENGAGSYSFSGIPNDGKEYRIELLLLNYGTKYDNESDADKSFELNDYNAVFGGDNVAEVDAHLTFVPPSYDQEMAVNAEAIGEGYRPASVLAKVLYRDTGDNHNFQVISQHRDDASLGVNIALNNAGTGEGSESIWKWHTNGTVYEYQMDIVQVQGNKFSSDNFNSDEAPFYIVYTEPVYWDNDKNDLSGLMVATLIPKIYPVTFDLNAGTDTVTGMDDYMVQEADPDEEGKVNVTYEYAEGHKWSYATSFSAVPEREGYTFLGWETTVNGVTSDAQGNVAISADVYQEVVLTAQWEQITYEVTTVAEPAAGGDVSGAGTYAHGNEITVVATINDGYTFLGWYEGEDMVCDELEYTLIVKAPHTLTAKYSLNAYELKTEAIPAAGGITTGDGTYDHGTSVELTATANTGYRFVGWQSNSEKVSEESTINVTVTEDVTYEAIFSINQHTVNTTANPEVGGEVTRGGTFNYGTNIKVKATAQTGYEFTGWYENDELVCETAEYGFEVTGDRNLEARFAKMSFDVTANADQGGTAEGTDTYFYGDTAVVKATVSDSYTFDGWYEGDQKVSDDLEYEFTVTSDRTLTAKFTINGYQVVAKPNYEERGTTSGSGYYIENQKATVTASAKTGFIFVGWYDENNEKVSDATSYTFDVTSDRTLIARFTEAIVIDTVVSPAGAGIVQGGGIYASGADITITAAANSGYYFVGWYDELNNYIAEPEFNLHVIENKTYTAKFERKVSYYCDYVYIFGYNDTVIGAEGPLLRGELAQMIYRLVKQNEGAQLDYKVFDDTDGEWFKTGISYMALKGAIDVNASTANPYVAVSRGETYKMICLGLSFTTDTTLDYSDYAAILRNSGYLTEDSAVTGRIARWEFCQLFNAIIGRTNAPLVDRYGNAITAETYDYTDLSEDDFYYEIMLRACSAYYNGYVDVDGRAQRNDLDEYYG